MGSSVKSSSATRTQYAAEKPAEHLHATNDQRGGGGRQTGFSGTIFARVSLILISVGKRLPRAHAETPRFRHGGGNRTCGSLVPAFEMMLVGAGGFEPPHGGTKNRCLTAWRRPSLEVRGT